MVDAPERVEAEFQRLKDEKSGYIQLKEINERYYVHRSRSVWDAEKQRAKKQSEHLGAITMDGEFVPKTPQTDVQVTNQEIYEYSNGRVAAQFLSDVRDALEEHTPYVDELIAMAIIRAIDAKPLRSHASRWEKLYLSTERDVAMTAKHLSSVLTAVGKGKGWWHEFFRTCFEPDDILLYDLTTVFSQSENIKRVEKGYNADDLYRDQIGVILAFSTATDLPAGIDVYGGAVKDISTFKEFLDLLDPEDVGFIGDRGLYSEDLVRQFRETDISYLFPLKKNSRLIDQRWVEWQPAFEYRDHSIRWGRRHYDLGTVYLFDDPQLRGDQQEALLKKNVQGDLSTEEYERKKERAGIIGMLTDLDRSGEEIYDLYKGRHDVELAFDKLKNHLDDDKTHLQSDDALRGYYFVSLLALRVCFAVLNRLREFDKTSTISVEEVFFELSKVERVVKPEGTEVYAHIPKQTRDIIDLFPEALPRG